MVFGNTGTFDVDRMIDLLQALEAFNTLGFVNSEQQEDGREPRFSLATTRDSQTRQALRFFFSTDGAVVRELLLEEVVNGVDALSRDVLYQLAGSVGLRVPRLLQAAAPVVSETEKAVLANIRKLVSFFFINGAPANTPAPAASVVRSLLSGPFASLGLGSSSTAATLGVTSQRLTELRGLAKEFGPSMTSFGLEIAIKISDRVIARTLKYVSKLIFRD
jgi:hypothetical protein